MVRMLGVFSAAAIAFAATGGVSTVARTDQAGAATLRILGPVPPFATQGEPGYDPRTIGALWAHSISFAAVPESVAINGEMALAGSWFSDNRVEVFDVPGDGQPSAVMSLAAPGGAARVATAKLMDRTVYSDVAPGVAGGPSSLLIRSRSDAGPAWATGFEPWRSGLTLGPKGLVVSRDGSRVAVALNGPGPDGATPVYQAVFLDGATGAVISQWTAPALVAALDITDDGSLAVVTTGPNAAVIDTSTGAWVFTAAGNGSGGRAVVSGDGGVVVTAGFDVRIWERAGGGSDGYVRRATFSRPGLWFGWGAAVSRDGTTVGVVAQDYARSYLNTWVFTFDAASGSLLGSASTTGGGPLQDCVAGGVLSDDGSVFATATWGTLFNDHPEVQVFDRACHRIGSLDTTGSAMAIDLTSDGRYAIVGVKGTHANVIGVGGEVLMYRVPGVCPCPADFDASGGAPDLTDITAYFGAWLAGEERSDVDCSGGTPDGTDIAEFFAAWLAGGC